MNNLKRIAAISGIIFGFALIVSIVLLPFAVSDVIDSYNVMVDEALHNSETYWDKIDLDKNIHELGLAPNFLYSYNLLIRESPDQQIHILAQDRGFEKVEIAVQTQEPTATISAKWLNDPQISKENILQLMAAEFDRQWIHIIVELPSSASICFNEDEFLDQYYRIDFEFTGFANYEELQTSLEKNNEYIQWQEQYNDYLVNVSNELDSIRSLRDYLSDAYWDCSSVEEFLLNNSETYQTIQKERNELLKAAYRLRQQTGTHSEEDLTRQLKEMTAVVSELCETEKQYDIQSVTVCIAKSKWEEGLYTETQYLTIQEECFKQQLEFDIQIVTLSDQLTQYLNKDLQTSGVVFSAEETTTEITRPSDSSASASIATEAV